MRSRHTAMKSSPCSWQLEKAGIAVKTQGSQKQINSIFFFFLSLSFSLLGHCGFSSDGPFSFEFTLLLACEGFHFCCCCLNSTCIKQHFLKKFSSIQDFSVFAPGGVAESIHSTLLPEVEPTHSCWGLSFAFQLSVTGGVLFWDLFW